MPVSANISTSCEALIKPKPLGPAMIPVSRKPIIEGILKRLNVSIMMTERPRIMTTSFSIGISTLVKLY